MNTWHEPAGAAAIPTRRKGHSSWGASEREKGLSPVGHHSASNRTDPEIFCYIYKKHEVIGVKEQGCFFLLVLFSNMLALDLCWALDNSFNTSSSLLRGTPSASKGAVTHIPPHSLLALIIYRICQLFLFVGCFRICSSLRSICAWPTLVPHSTRHFSAYSERVLRTFLSPTCCRRVLTVRLPSEGSRV